MPDESESALERMLPEWHFREVHRIRVPGTAAEVMRAAHATTWAEAPMARALVAITGADISARRRIVSDFLREMGEVIPTGDDEFLLAAVQGTGDVPRPPGTVSEIVTGCEEPGILKIGMNVRHAGGMLTTETRVLATDERTRRRFAPYWFCIRFGSGLTRTSMLRAIRARVLREMSPA
ncbi:hypothetical protein ACGFNV_30655 [Streptomyces sp. NPDC048751]|uniref:hypothetical protein n=1 Tax=Streptomyces sp. NPDC048751 TaxID=3365591 RepID=UPI003717A2A7